MANVPDTTPFEDREIAVKISHVSKEYRLGQLGGGTLNKDLQSWWARVRGKEDPNSLLGSQQGYTGDRFLALDDINLTIYRGEAFGILGHNGAGKSTLLKILSQVTAPSKGDIDIYGRISSMLEVGTGFNGEMTGRENVYMNGSILGMTKSEISRKMDQIIEFSECGRFIDTPVKRYSSGMYVKLAFSVAAHLDNEIMIMDEVLAVGDAAFREKSLNKMVREAESGKTILYVSHNMETVRKLCDRCCVLDEGKVIHVGDVERGIELYLDKVMHNETDRDLSQMPRSPRLADRRMKLIRARYIGKDNVQFDDGEPMRIAIEWENLADYTNLCMRFEVYTIEDYIIGSSVVENIADGKAGEHGSLTFEYDLTPFSPAMYKTKYTFYFKTEHGSHVDTDRVIGLFFERVSDRREKWDVAAWGHVDFNGVKRLDA